LNCTAFVLHCLSCRSSSKAAGGFGPLPYKRETAILVCLLVGYGLISYTKHCNWVTSEAYSSPSIVLISGWGPYRCGQFVV
jgi:dolichyl-diphosphooligosaccharide--protein glycosyltransferase